MLVNEVGADVAANHNLEAHEAAEHRLGVKELVVHDEARVGAETRLRGCHP